MEHKVNFPEEEHLPVKDSYTKEEIDSIDIFWCKDCLSLKIRRVSINSNYSYCDDCSSTNIKQGSMEEWRYLNRLKNSL